MNGNEVHYKHSTVQNKAVTYVSFSCSITTNGSSDCVSGIVT